MSNEELVVPDSPLLSFSCSSPIRVESGLLWRKKAGDRGCECVGDRYRQSVSMCTCTVALSVPAMSHSSALRACWTLSLSTAVSLYRLKDLCGCFFYSTHVHLFFNVALYFCIIDGSAWFNSEECFFFRQPVWYRLKSLRNFKMDCHEILQKCMVHRGRICWILVFPIHSNVCNRRIEYRK